MFLHPQAQWTGTHLSVTPVLSVSTILACSELQKIEGAEEEIAPVLTGYRLSAHEGTGLFPLFAHRAREKSPLVAYSKVFNGS